MTHRWPKIAFVIKTMLRLFYCLSTGVDDAESECGLDTGVNWDIMIYNNGNKEEVDNSVEKILKLIDLKCGGQ